MTAAAAVAPRLQRPIATRGALAAAAAVLAVSSLAPAAAAGGEGDATASALAEIGWKLLREGEGPNAVVSPLAVATLLGLVHAGAQGTTEREIEVLFGTGRTGARALRQDLPALVRRLQDEASGAPPAAAPPLRQAARVWLSPALTRQMPATYARRLSQRYGADAAQLDFNDAEVARAEINRWTAEHTAGRVKDLLPAGSISRSTLVTLTAALHFRSPWQQAFDANATEARPFTTASGAGSTVPTLHDERPVAQALVDGVQLYALPFAGGHDLVLMLPAAGGDLAGLLRGASGAALLRWRAALQPARCAFSMPRFSFAPRAASIKRPLQAMGVKTAFGDRADLRPMLGRSAGRAHVDDVHHAAGIAVDETGGEAVAAAAATVKPKSLAAPAPVCAVDRAFAFALVHRDSGAPLFMGRVGDPARAE